jgi:DNA primase
LGDNKKFAKYINSPSHKLFNKSYILFGLDRVEINDGILVIVEGYFDVIGLWQAGYRNMIGLLGTALTKYHLNDLAKRRINKIIIALDSDEAGMEATWKSAHTIARYLPQVSISSLLLPEGEALHGMDPDEIVLENPKLWGYLLDVANPVWKDYIDIALVDFKNKDSEYKQKKLIQILNFLNGLTAFMAAEGKKYLVQKSGYTLRVLNSLEVDKPKRTKVAQKEVEQEQPEVNKKVASTFVAVNRYKEATEIVNEQLKEAGLQPIGKIDFGQWWKNPPEGIETFAESLEHPEDTILNNIVQIRKDRLRELIKEDNGNKWLPEWERLMKI